jgi:hypothetical protein
VAVDVAQKDKRPEIPWEQVKKNLGLENELTRQHIHQRLNLQQGCCVMAQVSTCVNHHTYLFIGPMNGGSDCHS